MEIFGKVKDKQIETVVEGMSNLLYEGEQIRAIALTNKLKPMLDFVVITDARLLALLESDFRRNGSFKIELWADEIISSEVTKRMPTLMVHTAESVVSFGQVKDHEHVQRAVELLRGSDVSAFRDAAAQREADDAVDESDDSEVLANERNTYYDDVAVIGAKPTKKAHQSLLDHSKEGEKPWLVIANGSAGVLAAYEDRLLIAKVGAMTSFMSGSFGGGRVTTFHFDQIAGVEYNSGMVNGVLEVLTPSYQGTANKDFWRGTGRSRNADANDPYALSNCLPLPKTKYQEALPHLNELREKVASFRRGGSSVTTSPGVSLGIADEIAKLVALHEQGMLDETEFAEAKRAVINRYGN